MVETRGRASLAAHVKREGCHEVTRIAKKIGSATSTVYAWVAGNKRPGINGRYALARELGIPQDAWLTKEERKARQ